MKTDTMKSDALISSGKTYLEHYGVLGMRWGRRSGRSSSGGSSKHPKASSLSDAELKKRLKRMQDEDNYERLIAKRDKSGKTRKKVMGIVENAANQVATQFVANAMTNIIKVGLEGKNSAFSSTKTFDAKAYKNKRSKGNHNK